MRSMLDSREGYDTEDSARYDNQELLVPSVAEMYSELMAKRDSEIDYGAWEFRLWRLERTIDCGNCDLEQWAELWIAVDKLLAYREARLSARNRPSLLRYGETTESVIQRHNAQYNGKCRDDV